MEPDGIKFDLSALREDIDAALGQGKIDMTLKERLVGLMVNKSMTHFGDAYAYGTKRVKAVSGVTSTQLGQSTAAYDYEEYHPVDWRRKEDRDNVPLALERERQLRADRILEDISPELEEILGIQRDRMIGAAQAFVKAEIASAEKRTAEKYENRIKALEERLEVMIHMQNDENFGRF